MCLCALFCRWRLVLFVDTAARGGRHTARHSNDDNERRLRVGRVKRASSTRIVGRGNLAVGGWWLITNKSLFKHTRHLLEHQQQQRQFMRLQVCATSTYYYTLICSANVASCGIDIDTASQTPAARRECSGRSGSGELIMMVSERVQVNILCQGGI